MSIFQSNSSTINSPQISNISLSKYSLVSMKTGTNGNGNTNKRELLQSLEHVWHHSLSYISSLSLKCAIELGVPDAIHNHGQPMTLDNLVAALSIDPSKTCYVYRLMRVLVHSGFFAVEKISENTLEYGYVLTNPSHLLLKNNLFNASIFTLLVLDPNIVDPIHYLSEWFRSDKSTSYELKHGKNPWEYFAVDPRMNHIMNETMANDSKLVASVVIDTFRDIFEGVRSMVDVGGNIGCFAEAIADEFPHIHCTVLDLPHVVSNLESRKKNLTYVCGDMFEEIPPADVAFLKWILHDWTDENCVKILKQCKESVISNGYGRVGKVIIIDMVMDIKKEDEASIGTKLHFDIMMMAIALGRERNEEQWAQLFSEAGFSGYKIYPTLGLRSLIEVYP